MITSVRHFTDVANTFHQIIRAQNWQKSLKKPAQAKFVSEADGVGHFAP